MSLTLDQVQRVAYLARLDISTGEAQDTLQQLNDIFALIERMQAVDTSAVAPMAQAQDFAQRLRVDAVTEGDQREDFLQAAPEVEAGLYLVPKVIE